MNDSIKQLKMKDEQDFTKFKLREHDFTKFQRLYYTCSFNLRCMIPWRIRDKWNALCYWLKPRNRWATKVIPNHWSDKTYLIPEFLFASIIHFIEGEKALQNNVWQKKKEKELLEVYAWAKNGRKEFQEKIDKAYPEFNGKFPWDNENMNKETYEQVYGEVNRLEAEIEKIDTKHLTWIVKNRQILWS